MPFIFRENQIKFIGKNSFESHKLIQWEKYMNSASSSNYFNLNIRHFSVKNRIRCMYSIIIVTFYETTATTKKLHLHLFVARSFRPLFDVGIRAYCFLVFSTERQKRNGALINDDRQFNERNDESKTVRSL